MEYKGKNSPEIQGFDEIPVRFMPHYTDTAFQIEPSDRDLGLPTHSKHSETEVAGAKVAITMEVPDDVLHTFPVIIVNGFCGSESAYAPLRHALARNGTIAITYDAPRIQKWHKALHPKHLIDQSLLLRQTLWAVTKESSKLLDEPYMPNVDEAFDIVAHSMGARTATLTAHHKPAHYRSLLLNGPAGLDGQSASTIIARIPEFLRKETPKTHQDVLFGGLRYISRNPLRTIAEGLAAAHYDIRDHVRELGGLGVKSAIVAGRADTLIYARDIGEASGHGIADLFALYGDFWADHLYLQKAPVRAANAQVSLLEGLHSYDPTELHPTISSEYLQLYRGVQPLAQTVNSQQPIPFAL